MQKVYRIVLNYQFVALSRPRYLHVVPMLGDGAPRPRCRAGRRSAGGEPLGGFGWPVLEDDAHHAAPPPGT